MSSKKPVDKLIDNLKGLVIGASGNIPGFTHDEIKHMVEECGAKFEVLNFRKCTHLVATKKSVERKTKKVAQASDASCHIVNIHWLLESIKKRVPEQVHDYLIRHSTTKPADDKAETKKCDRENDVKETAADGKAETKKRDRENDVEGTAADDKAETKKRDRESDVEETAADGKTETKKRDQENNVEETAADGKAETKKRDQESNVEETAADGKAETKKRDRENDVEETAASKKAKNERKINSARLISLVDENAKKYPEEPLSVWLDELGCIWDVTLFNIYYASSTPLELFRIQILWDGVENTFHVYFGSYICRSFDCTVSTRHSAKDFESAKESFLSKFKERTGLSWDDRHQDPQKGWIIFEISHRETPITTQEVLTLPKKVEDVLKLVFESSDLDGYVASLNARGREVSFADPWKKMEVQIGLAIWKKQMKLETSEANTRMRNDLAEAYQQLVLGWSAELLEGPDDARKDMESLELVLKLKDAKDISQNSPVSSVAFSQIIQVLGLPKLDPINEETEEFRGLCEYLHESSIVHHPSQFQEVISVFRVERPGEAERFAEWEKQNDCEIGERRLLWHGSPCGNFYGILGQGLRDDGITAPNGKSFCSGIFFADMSTKSAGYCRVGSGGEALILLCEVELGKSFQLADRYVGSTNHTKWRDAGYIHEDFAGMRVPDVRCGKTTSPKGSGYYHSEYVASNPAQVIQRYLFHVRMK